MRVSARTEDPDYFRRHFLGCPTIRLDGREQRHVVSADDERGQVVVIRYGADGKPAIDREGERVIHDTLIGKVEIIGERRPAI